MADVVSVEKVLQKYCDCVFEAIVNDSTLDVLPKYCRDFTETYSELFAAVKDEFSADVYHTIVFYVEDSFNDYINRIIQNADTSVLRFSPDNVSDMIGLLREYCSEKSVVDFPEEIFQEIGLLISQKFRAFKNAVLFNRNITKNQETAIATTMQQYQQKIIATFNKKMAKAEKAIDNVKDSTMKTIDARLAENERKANESNITILGVFSAIVLVFNAAVSFYASAFNAFDDASIYKILTVLLVISIAVVCALMGLFYFLDRVRKSAQSDAEKYIIKTVCETSESDENGSVPTEKKVYILDKTEGKGSIIKSLLPFAVTIIILVFCLIAVLVSWRKGCVETRNKNISESLAQTTSSSNSCFEVSSQV